MTHPVDQFLLATVRDSGGAIGRLKVIRGEYTEICNSSFVNVAPSNLNINNRAVTIAHIRAV